MNRRQRKAHAWLWPILLAVTAVVFVSALLAKARVETAVTRAAAQQSK